MSDLIEINDELTVFIGDNIAISKNTDDVEVSIWLNKSEARRVLSILTQFLGDNNE